MVLVEHTLKNAYIGKYIYQDYTISNIPTTNTNAYVNVSQSGKTIQSVTISLIAAINGSTTKDGGIQISSNNSNTDRYGLTINYYGNTHSVNGIRGRLNGASDNWIRQINNGFNFSSGNNTIVYTINRDGNCSATFNGTVNTYTATGTELTIIQTIMNLSDMNVYAWDNQGILPEHKVDIYVTYS